MPFTFQSIIIKHTPTGPDEIVERVKFVQDTPDKFFAHFATITDIDQGEGKLAYGVGARCIVIAREQEENCGSIVFMEANGEGKISCIRISDDSRYHFRVDEGWKPTEEDDNL